MASSADVSSGDLATAAQYNNLRADVLNTSSGHTHTGTDSADLGTLTADLTISQSGASQIEVISTANDAYLILNSDTDEGQDSEIIFESGGTARGRIEYNHHATANTQVMSFFTADNAVETLKLQGNLATFATAVDLGSNTLTSTGSMQIRTIDYSDGDLAMTIADGGGVTFAQDATFDGDIAVNGDTITADGDLTINAASNVYIQDNLKPQADATYDLGSSGFSWRHLYLEGNITLYGTTSTGADTKIAFDGEAQDYHIGLDDSGDVLSMGKGTTLGTTTAFTIGSTPSIGFFRDAGANNLISIRPGTTLAAANAEASMIYSEQGTVNWTNASGGDATVAIQSVVALRTQAWAGASNTLTFTQAATLWIEGAPTYADANVTITNPYAFWVGSGISKFDGLVTVGTATSNGAACDITVKSNGDHLYLEQSNADNGWIIQTSDSDGHLHFERRAGDPISNTELMVLSLNGDLSLKGTTPTITIGDTGDEDAMIIWDTDHDFYMGSGNTENGFAFGSGQTMGSEMIWQAGTNVIYFVGSSGAYVKDDINWYWGTGADYRMKYDLSNTRWAMWSNDINGSGGNSDIIRIDDGQTHIDALDDWVDDGFDIYDDAMLLASSHSPTAEAYNFGKGVVKKGREALIEAGVLKRYEDGWVGYNDQRMAALLAGGIYQTRWLVDEMKEKISALENKVKALGG